MGRDQDHSLSATAEYQGHCYGPQIPLATAHAALLLPPGTGCHHSPTAAAAQEAGFAVHRDGVSPCRWSKWVRVPAACCTGSPESELPASSASPARVSVFRSQGVCLPADEYSLQEGWLPAGSYRMEQPSLGQK